MSAARSGDECAAAARRLRTVVETTARAYGATPAEATARRPAPGKWSAREILGHLIDSAANNHRRFVVGQWDEAATFDKYVQDEWVARQRYQDVEWGELLGLWRAYNRHLAHVIEAMPEAARRSERLRYLTEDYVAHLEHHLAQIRALLAPA